jgi:hypothetical protein
MYVIPIIHWEKEVMNFEEQKIYEVYKTIARCLRSLNFRRSISPKALLKVQKIESGKFVTKRK